MISTIKAFREAEKNKKRRFAFVSTGGMCRPILRSGSLVTIDGKEIGTLNHDICEEHPMTIIIIDDMRGME